MLAWERDGRADRRTGAVCACERERWDHFFASKRLQALLNDDPVGAADPPPPEDVTLITEPEMADWTQEAKKRHYEEVEKFTFSDD